MKMVLKEMVNTIRENPSMTLTKMVNGMRLRLLQMRMGRREMVRVKEEKIGMMIMKMKNGILLNSSMIQMVMEYMMIIIQTKRLIFYLDYHP